MEEALDYEQEALLYHWSESPWWP